MIDPYLGIRKELVERINTQKEFTFYCFEQVFFALASIFMAFFLSYMFIKTLSGSMIFSMLAATICATSLFIFIFDKLLLRDLVIANHVLREKLKAESTWP